MVLLSWVIGQSRVDPPLWGLGAGDRSSGLWILSDPGFCDVQITNLYMC